MTNQRSKCLFPNSSRKIAYQKQCQRQVQIPDLNAIIDRYLVKRMNESLRELFRPTASARGEFGIARHFYLLAVYIIWPRPRVQPVIAKIAQSPKHGTAQSTTSAVVTAQLLPTGESPN